MGCSSGISLFDSDVRAIVDGLAPLISLLVLLLQLHKSSSGLSLPAARPRRSSVRDGGGGANGPRLLITLPLSLTEECEFESTPPSRPSTLE